MKIGLVRHFKVDLSFDKKLYTTAQFNKIMSDYDKADVIPNEVNLNGIDWEICFASNLPRAVTTAETIFNGEIITTDNLIEVPLTTFTQKDFTLPGSVWHIGGRIAWYKNKPSQPEGRKGTLKRVNNILEMINSSGKENVLLVSHGFFIGVLVRRLYKLGFKGEIDFSPRNGKLYILEN